MIRLFICFTFILSSSNIFGQYTKYQFFNNSLLSLEANSVRCFLQDNQDLMWVGTNRGLYSYDGYESFPHFVSGNDEERVINCGLFYKEDYILLGTDRGILVYNYKYDKYIPFEIEFSKDIRSMIITDDDLWLGCADGLYRYNYSQKKLYPIFGNSNTGIIYAIVEYNGFIYVETNGCFGKISTENYLYQNVVDDNLLNCNLLVNSLLKDESRNCIWIGEGSRLTKFYPSTNTFESLPFFFPVVKSLEVDSDNNVIIGTDNGLYIYDGKEVKHFVHNSQKPNSLTNNIIWNIYKDHSNNIWLGTDFGISMASDKISIEYIPIFQISGTGEGNQFHSIYIDSKGFYWLGGNNGLIRTKNYRDVDESFLWYNMGSQKNHLSHNYVRNIYEDKELNLWVSTDFGINKYDYQTNKFKRYLISDKDLKSTATWVYDMLEDDIGNLWISCFNEGIFKINKNKLTKSRGLYIADAHYSNKNGLSSNNIDQMVFDDRGNIWALNHNKGIDVLNLSSGITTQYPILDATNGMPPNYLLKGTDNTIWVGYRNGIVCINTKNNKTTTIPFEKKSNALVLSLLEVGNNIWATSTEGIWIVEKELLEVHHINIKDRIFYNMYYDKLHNKIILGGVDEIARCSPSIYKSQNEVQNIIISSITVNNENYINNYDELTVRYSKKLTLPFHQNNLVIKFSDLQYSKQNRGNKYVFKLDEGDDWTTLKADENTIQLNKLNPGTYNLWIAEKNNKSYKVYKPLQIMIHPAWYFTKTARFIYLLLFFGLITCVIIFFHQKNKLKIAHIERKKTLEQTKLKTDFFTNIAHEFKTPLSLIIAPLSGLIHESKNHKEKDVLKMIYQNSVKLNSLVQQAINYYRDNSEVPMGLVLSRVDFVDFTYTIFETYKINMKDSGIDFIFKANHEEIFVDVDILKAESIINNLLSNACKYTNQGDTIILSLDYDSNNSNIELKVSDTGIGISEKDIPFIFQRFYQTNKSIGKEGTGIGLYLVKNFVELHGGTIKVISNINEGTSFTVYLPVIINNSVERTIAEEKNNKAKEKPLIAIVEDNVAIAKFIYNIFISEYRCVIAYNGKTGLKISTDLKPDIIISDIMMPGMDGFEMCQRLKNNVSTATIPIILLTAKDDKETELKSIHLKIDAFISKPFDANILSSRVEQLLEKHKSYRKEIRIEKITTPNHQEQASADEKFLMMITDIIEKNIANPDLNVSFLCTEVGVSQKQLYRKIKGLTGFTTIDYIRSIRMKKAAILLSNKNFTVAEVMYEVGFSNHSYFAKCFSAEFGKTPRQFLGD
ncbi:ATP-binding protein [Wenyingzhuangia sp. chi5]|uniref:histidine kinase n=1 Tax=Wenyingzhuangia gilva TaxID=3057677 RepID=A0ABT8VUB8_9FLAO|nr:ATP-binding protein [Wenyingzhuangia sp. chi5]MDO3695562.1 ATP-binding protein [Wenyingzhuangia sp. chi5]